MGRLLKRAGRIVPAPVLEAREQAAAILAAAHARAEALMGEGERARAQARQQGYEDGRATAAAELTETLARAALEAARVRARAEPEALRLAGPLAAKLAAKMTEKIVGRALDVEPALTADLVERALVASRARAGVVRLRVHPADLALLEGDETRRRLRAHLDARACCSSTPTRPSAVTAVSSRPRRCASTRGSRARSRRSSGRWPPRPVMVSDVQAPRGAGEPVVGDLVDLGEALARLDQVNPLRLAGRVSEVTGLVVRATIPGVRVGELVFIDTAPGGAARGQRDAPAGRGGRLSRRGGRADAARRARPASAPIRW